MYKKLKHVVFILFVLSCNASKINKQNTQQYNCAVAVASSETYKRASVNPVYSHPSGSDADEAKFILKKLRTKLNDTNFDIAWSAGVPTSNISVISSTTIAERKKITCILKEIMKNEKTKPIYVEFYQAKEVFDTLTKEIRTKKVLVEELIVE